MISLPVSHSHMGHCSPQPFCPTLILTTVSLTTMRSADDLLTLALHYPLFLLLAFIVVRAIPSVVVETCSHGRRSH